MDPNEALERFQRAKAIAENSSTTSGRIDPALWEAVDAAEDLFEWLRKGGYPPDRWRIALCGAASLRSRRLDQAFSDHRARGNPSLYQPVARPTTTTGSERPKLIQEPLSQFVHDQIPLSFA